MGEITTHKIITAKNITDRLDFFAKDDNVEHAILNVSPLKNSYIIYAKINHEFGSELYSVGTIFVDNKNIITDIILPKTDNVEYKLANYSINSDLRIKFLDSKLLVEDTPLSIMYKENIIKYLNDNTSSDIITHDIRHFEYIPALNINILDIIIEVKDKNHPNITRRYPVGYIVTNDNHVIKKIGIHDLLYMNLAEDGILSYNKSPMNITNELLAKCPGHILDIGD